LASSASIEILDLRHFGAPVLKRVLDAESVVWKQRLHWDYHTSTRLLMQYLDSHMLPGYAAMEADQVIGYAFCVYEESKAVIGDVFAIDAGAGGATHDSAHAIEETLLRHMFETLLNSPQLDRIESQLLLHPTGSHAEIFLAAGFEVFRRLFLVQPLDGRWEMPSVNLPRELELRPWREDDLQAAGKLIAEAYHNHPDSLINDQYRSARGSMRFLNNIVRYAGCGTFSAPVSHVVVHRASREFVALLLGSRVSAESGHITQVCVHPDYRRRGLARMLLAMAASGFVQQGASEISLTVTEANTQAIDLYLAEGYECRHRFDAAVWQRQARGIGWA
jgi:ribosomal protein S18 acetylase RimI-like enzyme